MKESATIALSYIRAHATELGIDLDQIKDKEIHIHVPEGAIPKDGPSAGITMVTSLVSGITRRKVRPHLAMTGEITLVERSYLSVASRRKSLPPSAAGITDIIRLAVRMRRTSRRSMRTTSRGFPSTTWTKSPKSSTSPCLTK